MIKISFDFDENTKTVKNLKCTVLDSTSDRAVSSNGVATVEVAENKLIISPEALALMGASAGDRISINYYQKSKEITIPVIGKSEIFADRESGNRLSASNTVSYRGRQRTILLEYGSIFTLEPYTKEGVFQLIPQTDDASPELNSAELAPEVEEFNTEIIDNFEDLDSLPF